MRKTNRKPEESKDRAEGSLGPGLYIVATPIGNLGDLGGRALSVLQRCDRILCEDTRVTAKLLNAYGLKKRVTVYDDHRGDPQAEKFLPLLETEAVALVSDAGSPLISDPGYKLVRLAQARGLYVTTIPGPNAVIAALQLSGLPSDQFAFLGFAPVKTAARRSFWEAWKTCPATLVVYETAPRLLASLKDMYDVLGDRSVACVREITKTFEEARLAPVSAHIQQVEKQGPPKGEIVLIVAGAEKNAPLDPKALESLLRHEMTSTSLKEAVATVAQKTGHSRKEVYALALALKET